MKPDLVQRQSRLKLYNILAILAVLYDCEIWSLKQRDIRRMKAAETKFMRRTARYRLQDHIRNEDILKNLYTTLSKIN
jgi:hypothetical protein